MDWKRRLAVSVLFASLVTGATILLFPSLILPSAPDRLPGVGAIAEAAVTRVAPVNAAELERRTLTAQEASVAFSYWMFWAVILQAVLAGGALWALMKELQQSRQSSEAQLRAYLSFRGFELHLDFSEGSLDIRLETKIFNGGQTPAHRCLHVGAILPLTEDGARAFAGDFANLRRLGKRIAYTVHNGQETSARFQPGRTLIPDEVRSIVENRASLYFFGMVEYDDIFKKRHATRFCLSLASPLLPGKPGEGMVVGAVTWHTAPFFNESD